MRTISKLSVLAVLAVSLVGCNTESKDSADVKLDLQSAFPIKQWKDDYSHTVPVKGKLLMGDKPVENAELQVGTSKRKITTSQDGSFDILVDQSLISTFELKVTSVDQVTVDGKKIDKKDADKLLGISKPMHVYYPIEIKDTAVNSKDTNKVDVHLHTTLNEGERLPVIHEDKYSIHGTVKDASNKPVEGAVVWITRDGGEGFTKSTPTDANGKYSMYYIPEEGEETNLEVGYSGKKYTLPENRVYSFPDETSVNTDITLPKEGTVIVDHPPTLVSTEVPGALYTGLVIGLDVGEDVKYDITLPDIKGDFTLTISKDAWDKSPTFYETNLSRFIEEEMKPGDTVPSSFLPKPDVKEPSHIKAVTPK